MYRICRTLLAMTLLATPALVRGQAVLPSKVLAPAPVISHGMPQFFNSFQFSQPLDYDDTILVSSHIGPIKEEDTLRPLIIRGPKNGPIYLLSLVLAGDANHTVFIWEVRRKQAGAKQNPVLPGGVFISLAAPELRNWVGQLRFGTKFQCQLPFNQREKSSLSKVLQSEINDFTQFCRYQGKDVSIGWRKPK